MKKLLAIMLVLAPLVVLVPKVSAHFPATSGTIIAELHVEPDDNPVVGKPQTLDLILSDSTEHFNIAGCACVLSISKDGQPLYFQPVNAPNTGKPTIYSTQGVPYTFATAGNYRITFSAQPLVKGDFEPFNLNWDLEVPTAAETSGFSVTTFIKYFAVILLIFLVIGAAVLMLN